MKHGNVSKHCICNDVHGTECPPAVSPAPALLWHYYSNFVLNHWPEAGHLNMEENSVPSLCRFSFTNMQGGIVVMCQKKTVRGSNRKPNQQHKNMEAKKKANEYIFVWPTDTMRPHRTKKNDLWPKTQKTRVPQKHKNEAAPTTWPKSPIY
jgi:hypothetical protein